MITHQKLRMILELGIVVVSLSACTQQATTTKDNERGANQAVVTDSNEESRNEGNKATEESTFTFDVANYTYQGGDIPLLQKERIDDNLVKMTQQVIAAVNESKTEVELASFTDQDIWMQMSIQMAKQFDPLVEIADFQADEKNLGTYHIEYGCSIEEHKNMVEEFRHKIESILKK